MTRAEPYDLKHDLSGAFHVDMTSVYVSRKKNASNQTERQNAKGMLLGVGV
jgi:hypothetical protein